MHDEVSAGQSDAERHYVAAGAVHEAVALLMNHHGLTRSDAVERLRDISTEVGIKLHEAAALVLCLQGP
jgi:AmiR/NasT family two-component response regulator